MAQNQGITVDNISTEHLKRAVLALFFVCAKTKWFFRKAKKANGFSKKP